MENDCFPQNNPFTGGREFPAMRGDAPAGLIKKRGTFSGGSEQWPGHSSGLARQGGWGPDDRILHRVAI